MTTLSTLCVELKSIMLQWLAEHGLKGCFGININSLRISQHKGFFAHGKLALSMLVKQRGGRR